jgi:ribose transport system permease protein
MGGNSPHDSAASGSGALDIAGAPQAVSTARTQSTGERYTRAALGIAERYGVVIALGLLFLAFTIDMPSTFPTWPDVQTMVNSQAIIVFLAIGLTLPLRAGDFDLSIAGTLTASGALTAQLITHGSGLALAIVASLALGLGVGLVNSTLVVKAGVDAFIVTLGMGTVLGGLAYAITDSQVLSEFPNNLLDISRTTFLGLPALTWYGWLLVIIMWFIYERTPFGRYLLFVGGSREAARLAGLRVDRIRMTAFFGSAIICALAGVLLASSIGALDPSVTGQFLLQPFTAAFLGATTITVGRFNAIGTLVGIYLLVVGITGLQLLGVQPWVTDVFNGGMLILAVTVARLAAKSRG